MEPKERGILPFEMLLEVRTMYSRRGERDLLMAKIARFSAAVVRP